MQTGLFPCWTYVGGQAHTPFVATNGALHVEHTLSVWHWVQYWGVQEKQWLLNRVVCAAHVQAEFVIVKELSGHIHWLPVDDGENVAMHVEQTPSAWHWVQYWMLQV